MPKPIEQKNRQKILIGILVVAVAAAGLFWYFNSQNKPSLESLIPGDLGGSASLVSREKIKNIQLDIDILDDSLFKSLKSHGVLPVTAGQTGSTNPFVK